MGPFVDQFFTLSPYLLAALTSFTVALALLQGAGSLAGRLEFGVAALATAVWNVLNFLEDGASEVPMRIVLGNLQYALIGPAIVLFFLFTVNYLAPLGRARSWVPWLLFALPVATACATWFDLEWGLVRSGFDAQDGLRWTWGPLFWAFWGQSLVLMVLALGLWVRWLWRDSNSRARRWTFTVLAALVVLTGLFNTLWLLGHSPWPGHDPTPVVMGLMGVPILWAVVRRRFLPLLPQARQALMDAHREPVLVLGQDGRLAWYNPAARVWGLTAADLGRAPDQNTAEGRWNDGERIWDVSRVNLGSKTEGVLVTYHDVTELESLVSQRTESLERTGERLKQELEARRRTEKQLFYFSLHDSMTGLPNRSLFLNRLEAVLAKGRAPLVVAVDFPDFDRVQARWGTAAGDEFIVQMGRRLELVCEGQAFLARNSADRFLLFTEDLEPGEGLDTFLGHLHLEVGVPVDLGTDSVVPVLRVGWTSVEPGTSAGEALADAEEARSRAGPGTVQAYQPTWRQSERERLDLHAELNRALVEGQLHLVYQPIVHLGTGVTVGYEALSRWDHPTRGAIPPNRFIPLAEEGGLIRPLGLWVLREAVETFASFSGGPGNPWVSVNVSPLQLATPGFAEFVTNLLERAELPPSALHLEITETALVQGDDLVPVIEALRAAGIHWKLDDFGTGYSSLAALHRLPVSSLKIDQSFIGRLPESLAVVKTILVLARELGLEVVAEGVETKDQEALLVDLGCVLAQGYLYRGEVNEAQLRSLMDSRGPV